MKNYYWPSGTRFKRNRDGEREGSKKDGGSKLWNKRIEMSDSLDIHKERGLNVNSESDLDQKLKERERGKWMFMEQRVKSAI